MITEKELCVQCVNDFNAACEKWSCTDVVKLVAERDAYREVAISASYDPWSHGEKHFDRGPAEKEVDKLAQRILEKK